VTFFCLIESENPSATRMEMLDAGCPLAAQDEAARLMGQHPDAVSAVVFTTETTIATLYADRAAA
jgi:hypothetical protein